MIDNESQKKTHWQKKMKCLILKNMVFFGEVLLLLAK